MQVLSAQLNKLINVHLFTRPHPTHGGAPSCSPSVSRSQSCVDFSHTLDSFPVHSRTACSDAGCPRLISVSLDVRFAPALCIQQQLVPLLCGVTWCRHIRVDSFHPAAGGHLGCPLAWRCWTLLQTLSKMLLENLGTYPSGVQPQRWIVAAMNSSKLSANRHLSKPAIQLTKPAVSGSVDRSPEPS